MIQRADSFRLRDATACIMASLLAACSTSPMIAPPSPAAVAELAPSGTLRAAINFGNPVLAAKDSVTGIPRGVSVDLSRELGRRLGVPVELVTYTAAGKVVEGVKANAWDVAFVAIDPVRGADMDQTPPYVIIEGVYAVPQTSAIRTNSEVDRSGVRVVVATGSAYDLYLTRELKQAQLVRVPTSAVVVDTMMAGTYEVAAGVRLQLEADVKRVPNARLLDTRFMVIAQAMALPKGRPAGARYLEAFVESVKASGFVADALKRNGIEGAAVAPRATN
jgi:polar amino acid transport system substrate-binding protein